MKWVRLTTVQATVCAILVVGGVGTIALWIRTHHADRQHGGIHLLIGAIAMTGGGVTLLGLDALNRLKRRR